MKSVAVFIAFLATSMGLTIALPAAAHADTAAARNFCAGKPATTFWKSVQTRQDGDDVIECGNVSYGAIHIESKHHVFDWSTTLKCLDNVGLRGTRGMEDGKIVYVFWYDISNHRFGKLVLGAGGVITGYTQDGGSQSSWAQCASA